MSLFFIGNILPSKADSLSEFKKEVDNIKYENKELSSGIIYNIALKNISKRLDSNQAKSFALDVYNELSTQTLVVEQYSKNKDSQSPRTLDKWLIAEGKETKLGEAIAEIDSNGSKNTIYCTVNGKLIKHNAREGEIINSDLIALVEVKGAEVIVAIAQAMALGNPDNTIVVTTALCELRSNAVYQVAATLMSTFPELASPIAASLGASNPYLQTELAKLESEYAETTSTQETANVTGGNNSAGPPPLPLGFGGGGGGGGGSRPASDGMMYGR